MGSSITVIDAGTDPDLAAGGGAISGDGGLVAFGTKAQLAAGDSNTVPDVYAAGSVGDPVVSNDLLVDFGGAGLWQRLNDAAWQKIHNASPRSVGSGDLDGSGQDDLIVDFGGAGLWARYNDATWVKLHAARAQGLAAGGFD